MLVTTLTKRMAEDLTEYYTDLGVKVRYLHSDVDTLERIEIIRDLRRGEFDVLVGINLLREGLDLPEVSLVAILDADKEGFLRSDRSLIQTCGRAARNVKRQGDHVRRPHHRGDEALPSTRPSGGARSRRRTTRSTRSRRRRCSARSSTCAAARSTPTTSTSTSCPGAWPRRPTPRRSYVADVKIDEIPKTVADMRKQMHAAAEDLDFEKAAELRDRIKALEAIQLAVG